MAGQPERLILTWGDVQERCLRIAEAWRPNADAGVIRSVYGVPRGGVVPAAIVATLLGLPIDHGPSAGALVLDDLVDSGATARRFLPERFDALYRKPWSPEGVGVSGVVVDRWVVFPWEVTTAGDEERPGSDGALRILQACDVDTTHPAAVSVAERLADTLRALAALSRTAHTG